MNTRDPGHKGTDPHHDGAPRGDHRGSGESLTELLRSRILRALHAGTLRLGDRLPSGRELVAEFGVDHRVILAAYRELAAEGLVELRSRGGIYVAAALGEDGQIPMPAESWLVELLAQSVSREVPVVDLHEWLRRAVETLRLRAVAIEATSDQIAGICRELRDDYGLEVTGLEVDELERDGEVAAAARRADLLVTTAAHASAVRGVASRLGKPCIVAAVRPDLIPGEWRLLLRRPVYIVVHDERFVDTLHRFFGDAPGVENIRTLVAGRDDLSVIPDGAPTYITRSARERLGDARIAGRILPAVRLFSAESARELITFIVRANLAAMMARVGR